MALAAIPRRPADLVARIGGEEFVVLLPDTEQTGAAKGRSCPQRRRLRPRDRAFGSGYGVITCSIGVATLRTVASGEKGWSSSHGPTRHFTTRSGLVGIRFASSVPRTRRRRWRRSWWTLADEGGPGERGQLCDGKLGQRP